MSEPSGDSPDASPAPPAQPTTPPQNPVTRAPRANPPSVFNPKDAPPAASEVPGAPPGFAEFMAWMKNMGGAAPAAEEGTPGRPLITKDQKKFSRRTAETVPVALPASSGEGAISTATGAGPSSTVPSDRPLEGDTEPASARSVPLETFNVERKRRSKDAESKGPLGTMLMQLLVFGLIVASFFFGRSTVPKAVAPVPHPAPTAPGSTGDSAVPGVLPGALQDKVDEAMQAESKGDFKRAEDLFAQVQEAGGRVYGLTHHLGELAYFEGDLPRTLILLNDSIAKGEEVAASYNLRGTVANRSGVMKGTADLVMAAKLDPFNARYAFYAGESLRRQGKPQAAVGYLWQALYRLHEGLLESFYGLKLRLALMEAGQEKLFTDEMATNLALDPPSIDWLFTAAAVEMHHGDTKAAAGYLDKARSLTTQAEMNTRLRDYYFFGFNQDKELARFFASIKSPAPAPGAPGVPVAPTPTASVPTTSATPGPTEAMTSPVPIELPKVP